MQYKSQTTTSTNYLPVISRQFQRSEAWNKDFDEGQICPCIYIDPRSALFPPQPIVNNFGSWQSFLVSYICVDTICVTCMSLMLNFVSVELYTVTGYVSLYLYTRTVCIMLWRHIWCLDALRGCAASGLLFNDRVTHEYIYTHFMKRTSRLIEYLIMKVGVAVCQVISFMFLFYSQSHHLFLHHKSYNVFLPDSRHFRSW